MIMQENYLSATIPHMPEAFKPARIKVAEAAKGIEAVVCEFYGITAETLCSPSRKDEVVMARHIIRYLLHVEEGYGIRTIARCLRKDHSQALKSIKLVKDYISTGGTVKEEITAIRLRLHA